MNNPDIYLKRLVSFKIPGIPGPRRVAGIVKLVLPDGRLEVKSQNDGYHKIAISEILDCRPPIPTEETAQSPAEPVIREDIDPEPTKGERRASQLLRQKRNDEAANEP